MSVSKVKSILTLAKVNPVLATQTSATEFDDVIVIEGGISSKQLGIVQTEKGLKAPKWFKDITRKDGAKRLVISGVDTISKEEQEKFYEMLKYKTISGIKLPQNTEIIVLASDLKNVSETILRLCVLA